MNRSDKTALSSLLQEIETCIQAHRFVRDGSLHNISREHFNAPVYRRRLAQRRALRKALNSNPTTK